MALSDGQSPKVKGLRFETVELKAAAANSSINTIPDYTKSVKVLGNVNDANDWITLPSLARQDDGHEIIINCAGGADFELRTPASSNEKINNVDSDGTQEYLCTDTDLVRCVKKTSGWICQSITNLGAVRTAVIPD